MLNLFGFPLHLLRGYVRVRVRGMYCGRFLSACAADRIPLYDLIPSDRQEIIFTVALSDFYRLHDPVLRNACHLHIIERGGLPFYLRRMRPRIVFFAGFAAVLILFHLLTGYIWTFEVTGCETVSPGQILRALEEEGIRRGTPIASVDPVALRNSILCKHHELIFLTMRFEGSHAVVEVHERRFPPEIADDSVPRNLTASHSGLVTSVLLRQGTALVSPGDLVDPGDMLIGGWLHIPILQPRSSFTEEYTDIPVRADGEVYARVWTDYRTVCPLETASKQYSGETKSRFAIVFGGFRINLYFSSDNSTQNCDIIVSRKNLRILPGVRLPITLVRETAAFYETDPSESDAELLAQALSDAALSGLETLTYGERLTVNRIRTATVNGAVHASAIGETLRDIAICVP